MSKEVVQNSACTLAGNVWDLAVTPAKPKTSGTIYAAVRLDLPGDDDDGKYWDAGDGGANPAAWRAKASVVAWPTAAWKAGSLWTYAVPAGASNGKAVGRLVLDELTDNIATPASSTVMGGGYESADIVIAARSATVAGYAAGQAPPLASDYTPARAARIDNLDATVNSRLASAGYTAPPSAAANATAARAELATELARIDLPLTVVASAIPSTVAISEEVRSELAVELAFINSPIAAIPTSPAPSAVENAAAARAELAAELARIDVAVSSRAAPMTGARQITLQVRTGAGIGVPGVSIAVYDSSNTVPQGTVTTDASGNCVANLNDGAYKLRPMKAGNTFTTPQTLVVSGDATATVTATAWAPTPPSAPNKCVVFGWVRSAVGPRVGAVVKARYVVPSAVSGFLLDTTEKSTVTVEGGYFELELDWDAVVRLVVPGSKVDATKTVPRAVSQDVDSW